MNKSPKKAETAEDRPLNITFKLDGEDKARLLRYERDEKFRKHATAAYKLAMERLEQLYGSGKAASVAQNA